MPYCHIELQDQDQLIDKEEILKSLTRVADILEMPTRKSIELDICQHNSPKVTQMIKFGADPDKSYVLFLF